MSIIIPHLFFFVVVVVGIMDFLFILFSFLAYLKSDVILYVIALCYYSILRSPKTCDSLF